MPPTLQERKQQLVRDAIWDAAISLFADKGFDETTVEEIAEAAGVSRRTFFRYFTSKSDLMAQGIVSFQASLDDAIAACPRDCSLAEVLRETVLRVAHHSASYPRTRTIMQIAARYPAAREAQFSRMAELQDSVTAAFARRCKRTSRKDLTPRVLAGLVLSVLALTFRVWFEQGGGDITESAGRILETLDRVWTGESGRS